VRTLVDRRFNKPAYKNHGVPVFWLREYKTAKWMCHGCGKHQQDGSVCFEFWIRFVRKGDDGVTVEKAVKRFFCLPCAEEMLSSVLEKVKLLRLRGVEAYRLLEEM
jgi:hypothetical protein